MAKEFTKDVGPIGTFFTNEGAIDLTKEDFDGFVEAFQDMQKTGCEVPVPWAHPEPTDPLGLPVDGSDKEQVAIRERAKFNAGWMNDLYLDATGRLHAKVEIKTDDDVKRVEEIGTFVSPQFGPWTNPKTGKKYPKAITHLALTPRPVNPDQKKEFLAVTAMSADKAIEKGQVQCFSEQSQFQMSAEDVMKNYVRGDKDSDDEESDDEDDDCDPDELDENGEPTKKLSDMDQLREALSAVGMEIPDSVKLQGDVNVLLAAAKTAAAGKMGMGSGGNGAPPASAKPPAPLQTENTVLAMSQESNTPPAAPVQTAEQIQMSADLKLLHEETTVLKREKYVSRIDAALSQGKCTPAQAEAMKALAGTFQFSAASRVHEKLEAQLEIVESNAKHSAWSDDQRVQQMSIQEERNSPFFSPEGISEERLDAATEELLSHMGYGMAKK